MERVGVLTGGGDCPGLNAVIRGVVLRSAKYGLGVVGFRRGWQGLLGRAQTTLLSLDDVEEIHSLGGTIIGTSRVDPFDVTNGPQQVRDNLERHRCQGLIVVGGERTLGVAHRFCRQGLPIVGVPKTIDNNVAATDYTFGFLTAINTATDAIDRLVTTAKSHGRVLVVPQQVLIPERPFDLEQVCERLKSRYAAGAEYSVIVVAEGARPADSNTLGEIASPTPEGSADGIAKVLAEAIAERTGLETRHVALGPLQRGGSPTAHDRVLGLRLGLKAAELVHDGQFGMMTSLRGTEIVAVPLEQAVRTPKTVGDDFYNEATEFFD